MNRHLGTLTTRFATIQAVVQLLIWFKKEGKIMLFKKLKNVASVLIIASSMAACVQPISYQNYFKALQVSDAEAKQAFISVKNTNIQVLEKWNSCLQNWYKIKALSANNSHEIVDSALILCGGFLAPLEPLIDKEIMTKNPKAGAIDSLIAARAAISDYVDSQRPEMLSAANDIFLVSTKKIENDNKILKEKVDNKYFFYKKCVFDSVIGNPENFPALIIAQTAVTECEPLLTDWQTLKVKQLLTDKIGKILKLDDARKIVQKQATVIWNETLSAAVKLRANMKKEDDLKSPPLIENSSPKQII
jgi:hypothetical protein